MGADMYIKGVYEVNRAKYEPLFEHWVKARDSATDPVAKESAQEEVSKFYELMQSEGYFRDSYNGTNVLNKLGLSWWQDIAKLQNKKGDISVRNAKKFLMLIEPLAVKPMSADELKELHLQVESDGENSVESWNKYFKDQKEELIKFIKKAIELKKPIEASF